MLKRIKISPVAEESFGVRSMCTYVETPDIRILLDAGVSLAPKRGGYPPHPQEYCAIEECRKQISKVAKKADIVTLSHYHFDHHTPSFTDWVSNWSSPAEARAIYEGKIVLIKNYRSMVNVSQRRRGWLFQKTGGRSAERLEIADSRTFEFGNTKIEFSDPVFHGTKASGLGWVLMTTIRYDNETGLFASDVQGPSHTPTVNTILSDPPQLLSIGGPPTYLSGIRVKEKHVKQGILNLERLVKRVPLTIMGHHTLRDEKWRQQVIQVFKTASKVGHQVVTAAEFSQKANRCLEARRSELFKNKPPEPEFEKWMKLPLKKRKQNKPPI